MGCITTRRRTILAASGATVTLSLIGLTVIVILFGLSANISHMYSIVLDAGSSSTKLFVYKWRDDPFRTNGQVEQVGEQKTEPGISSFIKNPFRAFHSFSSQMDELTTSVPNFDRSKVPVYLGATAGMRLQFILDPLGSLNLFEAMRRSLLNAGYNVKTPNERIRLLSGAEEGLYGWVSVNNIMELITSMKQTPPLKTIGSLDLGGASTQIAFVPVMNHPNSEMLVDFYPLQLFGTKYKVYSHSFLCYGKNEFENRVLAFLIENATTNTIEHPCFLKGFISPPLNLTEVFESPCVTGSYAKRVFDKPLTRPKLSPPIIFKGTGDPTQCRKLIDTQFPEGICTSGSCTIGGVYQPAVRGLFRAYSGYSFVIQYLFGTKTSGLTGTEIATEVENFCSRSWLDVSKEPDFEHSTKHCFDGLYIMKLLTSYGFKTDNDWRSITFGSKIAGKSVSWAKGYMLDESGNLPSESLKIGMSLPLFIGLTVIFLFFLVLSIIVLLVSRCHSKSETFNT